MRRRPHSRFNDISAIRSRRISFRPPCSILKRNRLGLMCLREQRARPRIAARRPSGLSWPFAPPHQRTRALQVLVRDNNVDQALRVLKKKMQREGVFREMKARKAYEKPSERKVREKAEAVRRARKAARKTAIREGLIAAPKPKPRFGGGPRRPGFSSGGGPGPQS